MPRRISQSTNFVNSTIDDGRLLLIEKIGSGSYGEVYKAVDVMSPVDNLDFYAVKCIHKPSTSSRRGKYLAREIRLHKRMSHDPHIVSLRNVIEDDEFVFLVMDYCPGGDMFTAISERNVYANNDALLKATFIDLIDAVNHCHEHKVFHRDLKPENILCDADGSNILLTDFGMATSDRICGEFNDGSGIYMSPGMKRSFMIRSSPSQYFCRMSL
jgi:serine/threonine protein kinase